MQNLENNCGISKLILMENAGKGAFEIIKKTFLERELSKKSMLKSILIICHHGNNGGDGFVIARFLDENQYDVDVLFIGDENKFKEEARINYNKLISLTKQKKIYTNHNEVSFEKYGIIVDCIFGTGVEGELRSPVKEILELVNQSSAMKVAIDIPSGIDPNSGKKNIVWFKPDQIITFHDIKPGLKEFVDIVGLVKIVDIGIKL